ncbi:outer membrane lipoprotein carrier protein LolA [Seongchinamella sediminis]|uniref:Outer-membrane lipoprotein carrier protein n=1 Tax=Seongchinamella sediminis TaxID=2283635 RepID=A0A3L7DWH1_9GAMM|nr:outer membrane lipoprotein chaperone LolA [Seongchinamella sediminis]RLQ20583.1 outer membrane lipoprotein carrier protein LolA [Seongchinamella sediminis]
MKKIVLLFALGLCLVAGIARSGNAATEQLILLLADLQQLQGEFRQTQYGDGESGVTGNSSGRFKLLKPHYVSWEIDSPDKQLIVADGEYLWHFDRDLETVTRRPVAGQQDLSPLQILAGDSSLLRENFVVANTGQGRFQLAPLDGNAAFKSLTLVFVDGQVSAMEVVDKLNQRLFIELLAVDADAPLKPADFAFVPPEGVDLFYHDQ